jgi:uncharacterized protein (DUF362 family)
LENRAPTSPEQPEVAIHRVGPSVQDAVRELLEAVDWTSHIPEGADVALKVNLTHDMLMPGSNTSPWVVEGVARTIRERAGTIYLVDADQVLIKVATAFRRSGLGPVCEKYGLKFHNLSSGRYEIVERELNGQTFRFKYPEFLRSVTTITLPVLKTHFRCMLTGALKNQYGCLDDARHNFHDQLSEYICLINAEVQPALSLMDGTVGMEGDGPKSGIPRVCDLLLASADPVALDSAAARVMGFDPEEIEHIVLCHQEGLGQMDQISYPGLDPADITLDFQPPHENFVAKIEGRLRHAPGAGKIFSGGLLTFFSMGAKLWYRIWYYLLAGRRRRNKILKTRYGPQFKP